MYIDKIFKGEMHRTEFIVANIIIGIGEFICILIIDAGINPSGDLQTAKHVLAAAALMGLVFLIYLTIGLAVQRNRSIGISPWFVLIYLIPFINIAYTIVLIFIPKDTFKNQTLNQ